jgi:pimeloyl-ACP methyl ester carboxylesterase
VWVTISRRYVAGRYGQVHLRETEAVAGRRPLVCLHATAYSSRTFEPLMARLAGRRQVIALDTPGYGGSDAPAAPIALADYARAALEAVDAATASSVDLLGYHTGAYVAAEAAILAPAKVRNLVMIGIPYFEALDPVVWRRKLCQRHELGDALQQFEERWDYLVASRDPAVSLPRAFGNFRDELAAWPNGSWAHEAMFDWDANARLPLVPVPTLVLNPQGHLAEPSRNAAAMIPDHRIEELPDLSPPIFDAGPDILAARLEAWLGAPAPMSSDR